MYYVSAQGVDEHAINVHYYYYYYYPIVARRTPSPSTTTGWTDVTFGFAGPISRLRWQMCSVRSVTVGIWMNGTCSARCVPQTDCYKNQMWQTAKDGGGDSLVVRAPDSWLKGRGFESLLERRENFLLQGRLSVLTLISVSVPPPCYHSST